VAALNSLRAAAVVAVADHVVVVLRLDGIRRFRHRVGLVAGTEAEAKTGTRGS